MNASLLANRETTRQALRREIAFNREQARQLRDEIYSLRVKAEELEREADHFQRELEALGPATLGVLA